MHGDNLVKEKRKSIKALLGESTLKVDSGETINQLCINSFGIALRPFWYVERYIKKRELVQLSIKENVEVKSNVYMLYLAQEYIPRKLQLFLDFTTSYYN